MWLQPVVPTMSNYTKAFAASLPKRGFSRIEAASYIGISSTKFDQLVSDGRLPKAKQIDGRKVWDIRELDPAFDELGNIDTSWNNLE